MYILLFLAVVIFGTVLFVQSQKDDMAKTPPLQQEQLVGADRDEHGCIGSAGYTWCEPKQKCLRQWEEPCESEEEYQKK